MPNDLHEEFSDNLVHALFPGSVESGKTAAGRVQAILADVENWVGPQLLNLLDGDEGPVNAINLLLTEAKIQRFVATVEAAKALCESFEGMLKQTKEGMSAAEQSNGDGASLIAGCEEVIRKIRGRTTKLEEEGAVRLVRRNCRRELRNNLLGLFACSCPIESSLTSPPLDAWWDAAAQESDARRIHRQVACAAEVLDHVKHLENVKGFPGSQKLYEEVGREFALCQGAVFEHDKGISVLGSGVQNDAKARLGHHFTAQLAVWNSGSGQHGKQADAASSTGGSGPTATAASTQASVASTMAQGEDKTTAQTTASASPNTINSAADLNADSMGGPSFVASMRPSLGDPSNAADAPPAGR